ncbi:MAG: ester cyclase [Candidatus Acidiferrales bacterium]
MSGSIVSIHITRKAGSPMESVLAVNAVAGRGLEGDRYFTGDGTFSDKEAASADAPSREATLVESESVDALNLQLGTNFSAGEMRRNIVTRGVALNHLVGRVFQAGGVRLRGIRLCEPCDHVESLTRKGLKSVMLHRCGLRAQIVASGILQQGDAIVIPESAEETNKRVIRRYYEDLWNAWNFDEASKILAPEIIFRGSLGTETQGRDAFCEYMRQVRRAFPDFQNSIVELVAEGNEVVARLNYTGTHHGELFGIAPTGRHITYQGAAFFRISDGLVAQGWVLGDLLSLLKSLGAQSLP